MYVFAVLHYNSVEHSFSKTPLTSGPRRQTRQYLRSALCNKDIKIVIIHIFVSIKR